jgi:hypothetical protein
MDSKLRLGAICKRRLACEDGEEVKSEMVLELNDCTRSDCCGYMQEVVVCNDQGLEEGDIESIFWRGGHWL